MVQGGLPQCYAIYSSQTVKTRRHYSAAYLHVYLCTYAVRISPRTEKNAGGYLCGFRCWHHYFPLLTDSCIRSNINSDGTRGVRSRRAPMVWVPRRRRRWRLWFSPRLCARLSKINIISQARTLPTKNRVNIFLGAVCAPRVVLWEPRVSFSWTIGVCSRARPHTFTELSTRDGAVAV